MIWVVAAAAFCVLWIVASYLQGRANDPELEAVRRQRAERMAQEHPEWVMKR